jgi:hypothetical protein
MMKNHNNNSIEDIPVQFPNQEVLAINIYQLVCLQECKHVMTCSIKLVIEAIGIHK